MVPWRAVANPAAAAAAAAGGHRQWTCCSKARNPSQTPFIRSHALTLGGCHPWCCCRLQVYGLPTLIVFKNGEEVPGSKAEGAIGKAQLSEYIKKYAMPVSASV